MRVKTKTLRQWIVDWIVRVFTNTIPKPAVQPNRDSEKRHVPRMIVIRATQPALDKIVPGCHIPDDPVFVLNEDDKGHILIEDLMMWYYRNWNQHGEHGITIAIHENGSPFSTMRQKFKRLTFDRLSWYTMGPKAYSITAVCMDNDYYTFNHLEWDNPNRPPADHPSSDNWVNFVRRISDPTPRDDENYHELTNLYWLEATA